MSDSAEAVTRQTAHPDTTATGFRRRAVLAGVGTAVTSGATQVGAAETPDQPVETSASGSTEHGTGPSLDGDVPSLIAHRGFAGLYPENTVGAVKAASVGFDSWRAPSRRADAIEIDVVPTGDGDVVVFHDDRLASRDDGERGLTDVEGVVWETDTDTVTGAEVLDSGETVPLLSTVLEAIPSWVGVNVELKNPGSFDVEFASNLSGERLATQMTLWRPFVQRVLDIADDHDHEFLFSSFYEAALATTRELSEYAIAPLFWDSIVDGLDIARTYDAEAIHPPYNMIAGTPFFRDEYYEEGSEWADIDLVSVAAAEDRDVNVYTLDTWYQAEQLAAAGVDGLIADHSDLLRFAAWRAAGQ
jgi:glycerophosphoryl diester phosphodiesterase